MAINYCSVKQDAEFRITFYVKNNIATENELFRKAMKNVNLSNCGKSELKKVQGWEICNNKMHQEYFNKFIII